MCGRKVDISHAPLDKVYYTVVHISKSCGHTRHAKSYTIKLDDQSLSKVFSCMTKVVMVTKCLQILAMPKSALEVTNVSSPKCNPYKLNCSEVNCTKVKSWHVAESSKLQHPKIKVSKSATCSFNDNVPRGGLLESFQFSTALRWSLVIGMCISIESSGATPETIKVLYKMQSVEAMMHTADKSVIQQKSLESDLRFNWIGLWKWTK